MENCLCNPLFRKLFNGQATVCIAVLNFIIAGCRLQLSWNKRHIFKANIWKRSICNRNIFHRIDQITTRNTYRGRMDTSPALRMKSVFEQVICPENASWHKIPCPRIHIPCPVLILEVPLTTLHQSGLWSSNWNKNYLKQTTTSTVTQAGRYRGAGGAIAPTFLLGMISK